MRLLPTNKPYRFNWSRLSLHHQFDRIKIVHLLRFSVCLLAFFFNETDVGFFLLFALLSCPNQRDACIITYIIHGLNSHSKSH